MTCEICGLAVHSGTCDRYELMRVVRELRETVRVQGLELHASKKLEGDGVISIMSLVSHRNQRPRVDIQVGEIHTQMDAEDAIDVGRKLIECASGSYADAFLFHWAKDKTGVGDREASGLLQDFREYREKLEIELKAERG